MRYFYKFITNFIIYLRFTKLKSKFIKGFKELNLKVKRN